MNNRAPDSGPTSATAWATLAVASCNLLNLASPGRVYYPNQDPYGADEYERKLDGIGAQLERLNASAVTTVSCARCCG